MAERHPTIEQPTEEQLKELVQAKNPVIQQLYLDAHHLVLQTLPGIAYSVDCTDAVIGYGARQYGYDGWGLAGLSPHTKWVNLYLMRGADIDDPEGLLEGKGKKMRHVKLRTLEEFAERRDAIRALLQAASRLNAN